MPVSVRHAIRRGMKPERDDRFPSMPALLAVFEEALAGDRRPRRRVWIAGGLMAVALTAGVTWRLATRSVDNGHADPPAPTGGAGGTGERAEDPALPQVEERPPSVPSADASSEEPVVLPSVDELPGPPKLDLPPPDVGAQGDTDGEAVHRSGPAQAGTSGPEPAPELQPKSESGSEPKPDSKPKPEPTPGSDPDGEPESVHRSGPAKAGTPGAEPGELPSL
jgi:hypothetical protein